MAVNYCGWPTLTYCVGYHCIACTNEIVVIPTCPHSVLGGHFMRNYNKLGPHLESLPLLLAPGL